jgi:hypothetical protein
LSWAAQFVFQMISKPNAAAQHGEEEEEEEEEEVQS